MKGRIHSFESMGAVDGPGLRGVVFMQGCPLRCAYCHNPDTWDYAGGEEVNADDLCARILRYRGYYQNGGVTVSGGEPLLQGAFVAELFGRLKAEGLNTALDTSGIGTDESISAALGATDLVMCDLKFADPKDYFQHTGGSMERVLGFLRAAESRGIPLWIRHVVVPGLTDGEDSLRRIARIAKGFSNLQKIELLPFRKLCAAKYGAMGIDFPLRDVPQCSDEALARCTRWLRED